MGNASPPKVHVSVTPAEALALERFLQDRGTWPDRFEDRAALRRVRVRVEMARRAQEARIGNARATGPPGRSGVPGASQGR